MKASTKCICIVSGILWGLILLYLAGTVLLPLAGLEYRFWVESIGKCLCILALPLWFAGVAVWKLWQRFQEKTAGRWLVRLIGGVAALLGMIWFFLGLLIILLSTNEDHYLGGGLVSVVSESFPNSVSYTLYERAGLFFRRRTSLTPAVAADYLADRYKRGFYPVEEGWQTLYTDAEREDIRVAVNYISGELVDDYPQALADCCLAEGYEALGLTWDSCFLDTGDGEEHFCLILDEQKNDDAYGADVYRLMQ
nr:hypothetical protein [Acetatifactor sp.]